MPATPDLAPHSDPPRHGDGPEPPQSGRGPQLEYQTLSADRDTGSSGLRPDGAAEGTPEGAPDGGAGKTADRPREALLYQGARGIAYGWTRYSSPTALPLFRTLRAHEKVNRLLLRDLLILTFFAASVATFLAWPRIDGPFLRAAVGGLAIYRIVDIGLTLVGVGIFGSPRHEATLHELPRHRVQRIMVAILINYLELMFWCATLCHWVAANDPAQFDAPVTTLRQAIFVSMSTLTTTGYSRHSPVGAPAMALATAQAIMGLVVLVMVIGGLVGSLREDGDDVSEPAPAGPNRFIIHGPAPPLAYLACVAVAVRGIGVG